MSTVKKRGVGGHHPCIVCEKKVGEKENGVQCAICEKWWQAACAGLRQEEYIVMQESATKEEQVLHWHCADCNKNAVGVLKLIKVIQERHDKMEKNILKSVRIMRARNVWKS